MVKSGDVFSRQSFGTVVSVNPIVVRNEAGVEWTVDDSIFKAEFTVADQFETTETLTRTELIEKILSYPRTAMKIQFRKKPDPKVVTETIREFLDGDEQDAIHKRQFRTLIGQLMLGDARVMIGRHYGDHDPHGRLRFLENGELRLVDPRTVEWAIVNNVKYCV